MKILKKILFLLSPSEKAQTAYLLFFSVIVAFLEMLGVVSIMPFIAVLANPKIIDEYFQKIFWFAPVDVGPHYAPLVHDTIGQVMDQSAAKAS